MTKFVSSRRDKCIFVSLILSALFFIKKEMNLDSARFAFMDQNSSEHSLVLCKPPNCFPDLKLLRDGKNRKSLPTSEPISSTINRGWTCRFKDSLSYCIYLNTLCVDENGQLFLLTNDSDKVGKFVKVENSLGASPWHLPDVARTFGRNDVPYRSFFVSALYASTMPWKSYVFRQGWSLVAAFDAQNYNLYHFMNKLYAAFIARVYYLSGLEDFESEPDSFNVFEKLQRADSEFDFAYLFRPSPTSWQQNYGEICLGNKTRFYYQDRLDKQPICFEKAVIPGAALYLADGLTSSILFRELAARQKGIRVPPAQRNFITIFSRSMGNRNVLNLPELVEAIGKHAPMLHVEVVDWDGSVSFHTQAMHMSRTLIMISTHGSVLNHNVFMEPSSVVMELNGYQFFYPLDEQIVIHRGNYYFRHEASLEDTQYPGISRGKDPYPGWSSKRCSDDVHCFIKRRDANIHIDIKAFAVLFRQALSLVL